MKRDDNEEPLFHHKFKNQVDQVFKLWYSHCIIIKKIKKYIWYPF